MSRLYGNPNARYRRVHTERIVRIPDDIQAHRGDMDKPARVAQKRVGAKRGYSERSMREINKYLPHVRRCVKLGHRPRKVPKAVLEKMIVLRMI